MATAKKAKLIREFQKLLTQMDNTVKPTRLKVALKHWTKMRPKKRERLTNQLSSAPRGRFGAKQAVTATNPKFLQLERKCVEGVVNPIICIPICVQTRRKN